MRCYRCQLQHRQLVLQISLLQDAFHPNNESKQSLLQRDQHQQHLKCHAVQPLLLLVRFLYELNRLLIAQHRLQNLQPYVLHHLKLEVLIVAE